MLVGKPSNILTISMIGAVGALWISLIGLFWLAVSHDGAIAEQVADSALKLVGAALTLFTGVSGLHVYVNRPAAGMTAGSSVQTIAPGIVVAAPAPPPAPTESAV